MSMQSDQRTVTCPECNSTDIEVDDPEPGEHWCRHCKARIEATCGCPRDAGYRIVDTTGRRVEAGSSGARTICTRCKNDIEL